MRASVGEGITVAAHAIDPLTGDAITDGTVTVSFYSPPKNPVSNTGDRTPDHGPTTMNYDADAKNSDGSTGAYVAYVSTTGWVVGKHYYRIEISGDTYRTWKYGTLTLKG